MSVASWGEVVHEVREGGRNGGVVLGANDDDPGGFRDLGQQGSHPGGSSGLVLHEVIGLLQQGRVDFSRICNLSNWLKTQSELFQTINANGPTSSAFKLPILLRCFMTALPTLSPCLPSRTEPRKTKTFCWAIVLLISFFTILD